MIGLAGPTLSPNGLTSEDSAEGGAGKSELGIRSAELVSKC